MTADFGGLRMKHLIKIIALISALCLVLGALSGCGNGSTASATYEEITADVSKVESGVIAENDYYSMEWNKDRAAIIVTSKADGSVWSTTPYDYLCNTTVDNIAEKEDINSSLSVTVLKGDNPFEFYASTASVASGRFKAEKIDNGISITYYFDEVKVFATVDYYLEDNGFKLKVDNKKIKSFTDSRISKITPAPFMCATKNTAAGDRDSYFVIPSGSGSLMYLDERADGIARTYSADFYGRDYSVELYNEDANATPMTMPFYGMKRGAESVCAIIESGAESSMLNVRAGDVQGGYSYINASYYTVGYNNVYSSTTTRVRYNYTEPGLEPLVIGYYTLSSNAGYTEMAKRYQKYLVDKKGMKESQDNSLLTVELIGSYVEDDLFLGLPTNKKVSLTTYNEAQQILTELNEMAEGGIIADMYGYGDGGINADKLAAGYKLTGVVGNKDDLTSFVNFAKDSSIKTFFNFDTVLFYGSGNGFSVKKDSAVSVNGIPAPVHQFWYSTRVRYIKNQGGRVGALISRDSLAEATLKTVDLADEYGITGLAYNTLGNIAYSDYVPSDENKDHGKYPLKARMGLDVSKIITDIKANSKTVMIDGAYDYAAVAADIITGCPTISDQSTVFDKDIPLYQIVFQGYKSNSVESINTSVNRRTQFLKAIETGSGLSFTLMANYYNELRKQYDRGLNASLYEDNKEFIKSCIDESKAYLASVAGETINSHEYITDVVTKTVFSNGVTVYVNFSDADYSAEDIGTVKANSFLTK